MPFEYFYYGSTKPTIAIVTMGSSAQVVKETLKHIQSEQACLIGVRLFRPWLPADFCKVLPLSIKRVASLDRTKESGAQGEPLYMDVCASLMSCNRHGVFVAGGRYGLASKGKKKYGFCRNLRIVTVLSNNAVHADFSPRMVVAVLNNMLRKETALIQHPFTVGIIDDVTNLSLPLGKDVTPLTDEVTQCVFWGFGSDGTVGANKEATKIM